MKQHGSKYFTHNPTLPTPGVGSKGQNSSFPEKKKDSRKQQHSSKYSARRPPPPDPREWGQNSAFQNMVILQIKL